MNLSDIYYNNGIKYYHLNQIATAKYWFELCLTFQPNHANAVSCLGTVYLLQNNIEQAEYYLRKALILGAEPKSTQSNLALLLIEQAKLAEAEMYCRKVLAIDPSYASARFHLSLALLTNGDLKQGFKEYESRWNLNIMVSRHPISTQPRWTGERLVGKSILLYSEQGMGDTIMFSRYVGLVKNLGGEVILAMQGSLVKLLKQFDCKVIPIAEQLPVCDYQCPLMSLPLVFNTTLQTIPSQPSYLYANSEIWAERLKHLTGLKVGIVWQGSAFEELPHTIAVNNRRSIKLCELSSLLEVKQCSFISLQLENRSIPNQVHDMSNLLTDWGDTAGLITCLDLIITVDTAVVHLAGALGKEVWLLNRFDTCWRWFKDRDDSPWYPSLKQFRQPKRNDWASVIKQVKQALEQRTA